MKISRKKWQKFEILCYRWAMYLKIKLRSCKIYIEAEKIAFSKKKKNFENFDFRIEGSPLWIFLTTFDIFCQKFFFQKTTLLRLVQGGSEKTDTPVIYTPHKSFFCRFFEIFSKQPTTWYKYKTLVSWISGLYHSLTSKAAKMSINTAISEKVIEL